MHLYSEARESAANDDNNVNVIPPAPLRWRCGPSHARTPPTAPVLRPPIAPRPRQASKDDAAPPSPAAVRPPEASAARAPHVSCENRR